MASETTDISTPPKSTRKVKPIGADGHRGRMFDRLFSAVDYGLSHRDLLEILLFYGIRMRDTRDQAVMLMNDNNNNIQDVLSASTEKLKSISGIGDKTALMLRAMGAASSRINSGAYANRLAPSYTNPDEIAKLFVREIKQIDQTETWVAAFDSAMHIKKIEKLINRELDPSPSDMRMLLDFTSRRKVDRIAVAIIRQGDYNFPSVNDIALARHMMQSFYRIGRSMIEYVIINDAGYSLTSPHMI